MNSQFKTVTAARDSAPPAYHTLAPSTTPCKFATTCTRPDCKFAHPARAPAAPAAPVAAPSPTASACKFAMGCERPECKFAHPNRLAPVTARLNGVVKMCRTGDSCTRSDCHFGHASPEFFKKMYIDMCIAWKNDFNSFRESRPSVSYDEAFAQYLLFLMIPVHLHMQITEFIETAEMLDEQQRITDEMDQCNYVTDCIVAATGAAALEDDADEDDDAEFDNADLDDNDPDANEDLAAEIAAAFTKEFCL